MEEKIIDLIEFADIQHYMQIENKESNDTLLNQLNERVMGAGAAMAEMVLMRIEEDDFKSKCIDLSLQGLLGEMNDIKEDVRQNLFHSMVRFGIMSSSNNSLDDSTQELEKQIRENAVFDILCSTWVYLIYKKEEVFNIMNQVMQEYQKYTDCTSNPLYHQKRERIADYLSNKVPYQFSKERILQYINTFEEELLILFHNMECERVRQKMNNLFSSNRYLVSRLIPEN